LGNALNDGDHGVFARRSGKKFGELIIMNTRPELLTIAGSVGGIFHI
jgi:hypothetical protein